MPLETGSGREVVSRNISELTASGRKQSQAVAIALNEAGKSKKPAKKRKYRMKGEK